MTQDQPAPTSIYCRECGYLLAGLSANRCPECGRAFDPNDPRTFLNDRHGWIVRHWFRRLGLWLAWTAAITALGLGSLWGYVYWQYHGDWMAEQKAIAALRAIHVDASGLGSIGSERVIRLSVNPFLDRFIGPLSPLLDRVQFLNADNKMLNRGPLTDADFANMSLFKHLEYISIQDDGLTDDQIEHLKDLKSLRGVAISGRVTNAGLVHLQGLARLTDLSLSGTKTTGAGIKHLQGLTRLQSLSLRCMNIQDADLPLLKVFPALRYLSLRGTAVTMREWCT